MKNLVLAYLLAVLAFFLPLACSKNVGYPVEGDTCGPPECLVARQAQPPICIRVWRSDLGDSLWDCSEPRPPEFR